MPENVSIAKALAERFTHYREHINQIADQLRAHRKIIDLCPLPCAMANNEGDCIYANKVLCDISGTSVFEMQGTGWQKFIWPGDLERVMSEWYAFARDPALRTFEIECGLTRASGKPLSVLFKATQMADGNIISFGIPLKFSNFVAWIKGADMENLPDI